MFYWIGLLAVGCAASLAASEPNMELSANYNNVDKAKFCHPKSQRRHHFRFKEGYVLGTFTQKLKAPAELTYGLGYMQTQFHFSHHPKRTSFRQEEFRNLLVQFGGATQAIEKWNWNAGLGLQMNTEHFNEWEYTFFNGVLHGAYDYEKDCHIHVGVVGYTGMRYTHILPIVGFDKKISDKWQLNAVFPVNMALIYKLTDHWSVDGAIRYMITRQRLDHKGHYPKGLVAYRNWGAEGGVNYAYNEHIRINLHAGNAFAGRMRISNHRDSHRRHLRLDSSLYYGLSANIAF